MGRIVLSMVAASAVASLPYGVAGVIAFLAMLFLCLVLALPLFLWFRRLGWVQWWHAASAGALFGIVAASVAMPYVLAATVGTGLLASLVFWCLAVFRNPGYRNVSPRWPVEMLSVLPAFYVCALYAW